MADLKPLQPIKDVAEEQAQAVTQPLAKAESQIQMTGSLLQKVNGELCFYLQFGDKSLLISESKCSQLIPEFKKMNAEQKETFLMQAAIFGANPFTVPAEIYPLPFASGGVTTYAPCISAKKYVENAEFKSGKNFQELDKKSGKAFAQVGTSCLPSASSRYLMSRCLL